MAESETVTVTGTELESELRRNYKSFLNEAAEYYEYKKNMSRETAESAAVSAICAKALEALSRLEHINTASEAISSVRSSSFGKSIARSVGKRRRKEKLRAYENERLARRNLRFERKCEKQGLDLQTEKAKRAKAVKALALISVLLYILGAAGVIGAVVLAVTGFPLDATDITRVGLISLIGVAIFLIGHILGKTGKEMRLE